MKHLYITLFALCSFGIAFGQSLELSENYFEFGVDEGFDYGEVTLTNVSDEDITIAAKLERRCHADDGSGVQFCFGILCHGPYDTDLTLTAAGTWVTLGPGESTDQLTAHLWNFAGEGSSWRLYYYDAVNPSDEVFMDILFGDCSDEFTIVSVDEQVSNGFEIYPNPASDQVNIIVDAPGANYMVFDLTGKMVQSGTTASRQTILNVSSLEQGIYFVQIGELRQRLVVR